ncbi:hypothetical protein HMPREF1624_03481 [Sporothrix schenckii ATCC 58251]|uniref:Hsp70-like protein n=1 Tax=Sporothrix schenckii (strain ATCC 58251 / de Perez 2211183) TaxID=1391915 RepID=U7PYV1_SPOS1|nr:hypothetical protein HMPREF1624_03481 [Sporothrix schenckii ATCC 58251]
MSNNGGPLRPPPPPAQRSRDTRSNYFATYTSAPVSTPTPPPPPPPIHNNAASSAAAVAGTTAAAAYTVPTPPPPPPPRVHASTSSSSSLLLTPTSLTAASLAANQAGARGTVYSPTSPTSQGPAPSLIPGGANSASSSTTSLFRSNSNSNTANAAAGAAAAGAPVGAAVSKPASSGTPNPPSAAEAIHGPVREPVREFTPPTDRLIVGVDFGTTFSGVAAVYTPMPDDIEIIKTWPGGNGITSDKVPTEMTYDLPIDAPPGTEPTVRWGFQFKPEESRLRCIKLFLDRTQKLPFYVSPLETAAQLSRYKKTVVDAVADYLTQVYRHTMDTLSRRYGASFMASTRVDFVLTCPAVWSDAAKNTTLLAAERAGMGDRSSIQMISEPEAAAVYTLKAIQPNHLNVGDNFIVCDGGGGTVDLIAYKIISLKPLRVEESAVGTGGLCGSAFLNYRFEEHVCRRLGQSRFDEMKTKKNKTWQMGLRYFEEFVKRNFNEDEHQEVNIPFPGLPDDEEAGLDSGFLVMSAEQVLEIFEPIVKEVCDLVQGQVDKLRAKGGIVSGIILVGGFGQSDYLYRRLKHHFRGNLMDGLASHGTGSSQLPPPPYSERPTHAAAASLDIANLSLGDGVANGSVLVPPIEVMQPVYAWTAVVRGAVLRGLEGSMVLSRRARFHYGTSYATVYDEAKHSVSERYWSPLWERWMVSDRMQWHIAKGDSISPLSPIAFHYTRNFRPGQSLIVTDDLIACAADEPPDSYTRGGGSGFGGGALAKSGAHNGSSENLGGGGGGGGGGDGDDADGNGSKLIHVCTLTTDLSAVPRSLFTRLTTTRGVEFDNLDFTLEMVVDSAGLGFELKVDGVRYGRVEADFH